MNLKETFSAELQKKNASLGEVAEMLEGAVQVVTDIFNDEHRKLIERIVKLEKLESTIVELRHEKEIQALKIAELQRQCEANKRHVTNVESKVDKATNGLRGYRE